MSEITEEDILSFDVYGLLKEVKAIKAKNDAVLEATGGRFNIFQILGVNQHETTHSKIIASFLNPKGTHGMKERFLELFLAECFSEEDVCDFNFDCKNAVVNTESYAPTGEIQGGIEYKKISYGKEILNWIENCCAESAKFPLVRETLVQYANLIRYYTGESMSAKAANEIINTIANDENIGIAQLIVKNYQNAKNKIAYELLYEFGEFEKIARKTFGLNYKRNEKGKLGSKDFIIRYDIEGIEDVRIAILFGDSVTEKEKLIRLKINLEFRDGKNTPEKEKTAALEKYRNLLADIPHQVNPSEYSAWRMQFEPWETQKSEIVECFDKMAITLKNTRKE